MSFSSTSTARSQEIWFDNGDLILHADDALFRVHSSILRKHSLTLDGIIRTANKIEEDMYEGCPVIRMQDTGLDLSALLRAMYTPSYRPTGKTDAEVKDLISILLLGTKYGAISLRKRTLAVLSRQFPPTLEQWDSRRFNVHFERNIFAIANVVRQCCAFSLLPTVLLHCYLRQTFNVLVGCGSVGATHELDPANEQAVLLAQQYLASQIQEDVFPDFFDFNLEVFGCHDVLRCCRAKGELNKRMKASPNNWIYDISTMEARLKKCDFCQTCNRVYIKYYADGRKKIWEELPQYFSLPPWSVLAAASEEYSLCSQTQ